MIRMKMLAGVAAVGLAVTLPAAPSFAQSEAPVLLAQQQGGQPGQMSPDQMRQMIREAVREMMMQRMQEQGGPEGGMMRERMRERAAEMRDDGGWRDRAWRRHMHRHGMGGPGMMRGFGMKIMFAVMDSNGDGRLTLDEMNDFHARIFRAIDKNQQGYVTEEDIKEFLIGGTDDGGDDGGDQEE